MPLRRSPFRRLVIVALVATLALARSATAYDYTVGADLLLRVAPRGDAGGPVSGAVPAVIRRLDHNETVMVLPAPASTRGWRKVRVLGGQVGYLPAANVRDVWLRVFKQERQLALMRGSAVLRTYRIALSRGNPLGDKRQLGDQATPEGRFFIAEAIADPADKSRYGARSLRISYPSIDDARRGLRDKLIDYRQYVAIVRAVKRGQLPDQRTRLGGSIRIHGGGSARDWTLGCMALDDADVKALYAAVGLGTRVEIHRSAAAAVSLDGRGALNRQLLAGARAQLARPAAYTRYAMAALPLAYPGGDLRQTDAVCSDIVVRAARHAGIDLQAEVHEDRLVHPERYRVRERPSANIDHRRVRNLHGYLSAHAEVLDPRQTPGQAQPGDIVLFDTGVQNGTPFDHIGVVGDRRAGSEQPYLVINIWTVGYRTQEMPLVGQRYPTVVGHFRLAHALDYAR